MTLEIKKNAEQTTITVAGRLDTITAPVLEQTINDNIIDTRTLILNLAGLEYISSAGLRVLLGAHKKMKMVGSMKLVGVREEVMEILEMTGFADILVIE
jgi:anti-sigma B factor antagonist